MRMVNFGRVFLQFETVNGEAEFGFIVTAMGARLVDASEVMQLRQRDPSAAAFVIVDASRKFQGGPICA